MTSMRLRTGIAFAVGVFLCGAPHAGAQQPVAKNQAYRLRLLGVYDEASGMPVEGVKVSDVLNGASSLTTATGTVSLVFLPDGGGMVRLQKIGYATQTFSVAISPADTAPLTITMKRVTQLPTVVTTDSAPHYLSPALRGFVERQKQAISGYFITEAELRKNEGRKLATLLRSKPGITIKEDRIGTAFLARSPRCTNGGPPQVYLDGVMLTPNMPVGSPAVRSVTVFGVDAAPPSTDVIPFDLSQYDLNQLAGVEWYPSSESIPVGFAHPPDRCGALMLWTRER
jgi:hypothetical protein